MTNKNFMNEVEEVQAMAKARGREFTMDYLYEKLGGFLPMGEALELADETLLFYDTSLYYEPEDWYDREQIMEAYYENQMEDEDDSQLRFDFVA